MLGNSKMGGKIGGMRYFCTYFDRNYLVRGLALLESLKRHEKKSFTLFIVCLDEITRIILKKLSLANVVLIPMHEIESRDFKLLEAKKNRQEVEYYWTATPTVILRLLERNPEIDILTYLDSDLYFFSSSDPIFKELGNRSVLIQGHRFPPRLKHLEIYGKYNVGLLSFRNDAYAFEVLNWWRERCIEWCYGRVEDGKYADQLYLNDWTGRFRNVVVLENIGAGVGPWNHEQYRFETDGSGNVLVDDKLLVFYHFHSLAFVSENIIIPAKFISYPLRLDIIRFCFIPYIKELKRCIAKARDVYSGFEFGLNTTGVLTQGHAFIAQNDLHDYLMKSGLTQNAIGLDDKWQCYCSMQLEEISAQIDEIKKLHGSGAAADTYQLIDKCLEVYPDSPDFMNLKGELLYSDGKIDEAIEIFREIVITRPRYWQAYNNLAVISWDKGDVKSALKYFENASKTDSLLDAEIIFNYVNVLIELKRFKYAKKLMDGSIIKVVNYNETQRILGEINDLLENVEQLNKSGEKLFAEGKVDEAQAAFLKIFDICSDYTTAYNNLAVLAMHKGDHRSALKHLSVALEIDPDDKDVLTNYMETLKILNMTEGLQRMSRD